MGLYIGMAIFWIVGIRKPKYWNSATLSNVLFMSGLAFGRTINIILDRTVSPIFAMALIAEIILAIWGISNLRKYGI